MKVATQVSFRAAPQAKFQHDRIHHRYQDTAKIVGRVEPAHRSRQFDVICQLCDLPDLPEPEEAKSDLTQ